MSYANHYSQSHALVIGIGEYEERDFPPLPGATRDALDIARVLESDMYSFDVTLLLDEQATKTAIQEALDALQEVDPDSRAIVYFAGHGANIKDKFGREHGVVFAHDSRHGKRYRSTWLNMRDDVTSLRSYTNAKHLLFIFDSCFSGKALGLTELRGISDRYIEKAAYQALTGGAVEVVVDDPSMTRMLLPLLEQPDTTVPLRLLSLFRDLQDAMARAHCVQTPQVGHLEGSEGGDFVFYVPPMADFRDSGIHLRSTLPAKYTGEYFGVLQQFEAVPSHSETVLNSASVDALYDEAVALVRRSGGVSLSLLQRQLRIGYARASRLIQIMKAESVVNESGVVVTQQYPQPTELVKPEMIWIPVGTFLMDTYVSNELRSDSAPTQLELDLDYGYAIGKYPITVGQFRTFIDLGAYNNPKYWTKAGWQWRRGQMEGQPENWSVHTRTADDGLPVVNVSWYEAYAYTRWLAKQTGKAYRLPTEPEWEKAARGGLWLPDAHGGGKPNPSPARVWPWGDDNPSEDRCNFDRNVGRTTPVGMYPAGTSPYGVMDMAGNVWEWCLSLWGAPSLLPQDIDVEGEHLRVLRGGSWFSLLDTVQGAHRIKRYPHSRTDYCGFRVVCDDP